MKPSLLFSNVIDVLFFRRICTPYHLNMLLYRLALMNVSQLFDFKLLKYHKRVSSPPPLHIFYRLMCFTCFILENLISCLIHDFCNSFFILQRISLQYLTQTPVSVPFLVTWLTTKQQCLQHTFQMLIFLRYSMETAVCINSTGIVF